MIIEVRDHIPQDEYLEKTYAGWNRKSAPDLAPPETPEEYIRRSADPEAMMGLMMAGMVEGLDLNPAERAGNKPLWLGDAPQIDDIAYEMETDALVIGAGPSGTIATLRLAELGVKTLCIENQTLGAYDAYACDMATYNSKFFRDLGVEEYDLMEIFNEYMRRAVGHAHPKLVRDYVTRSGEMLDWMLQYVPKEYIDRYAHATQYKGNSYFSGSICGQKSFIGMLQWRDTASNCNMWPFIMRSLHRAARDMGAEFRFGVHGVCLLQDEHGAVTGCIARDEAGKYFRIRAKAVVVGAGDFGGNPDMRLDLCDTVRNLAWSHGMDRTDVRQLSSGGRDGSGIRMCLWAGGRMEAGPRAGQGGYIARGPDDMRPRFPFGGTWPTFGPDGKRFMNETLVSFGPSEAVNMLPMNSLMAVVTDADWDIWSQYQGYGHEVMDRSNDYMLETVRSEMANYKTGPDGFLVHSFSHYGDCRDPVFAADTLEELGQLLGYEEDALEGFLAEVAHWNEMCDAKYDSDWGCDPNYMFPIRKAPFFGVASRTGGVASGGLCQNSGVCTDGYYRVLNSEKQPIPGLYAVGNTCGQRFGIQYATPTAGNCCGSAMTTGYVAAECVRNDLK